MIQVIHHFPDPESATQRLILDLVSFVDPTTYELSVFTRENCQSEWVEVVDVFRDEFRQMPLEERSKLYFDAAVEKVGAERVNQMYKHLASSMRLHFGPYFTG